MAKIDKAGIVEFVKTVAFALIFATLIRTAAFGNFYIPSSSMVPNLLVGDRLFVSKFAYGYSRYSLPYGLDLFSGRILARAPTRGDVVVFKWPGDNDTDYIKRLIGLPGETIEIRNEQLYINGILVPRVPVPDGRHYDAELGAAVQTYVETLPGGKSHTIQLAVDRPNNENFPRCPEGEARCAYTIPAGTYFMMGDNRDNSADSRVPVAFGGVGGALPAVNLVGRAEIVYFSADGSAELWEPWKWPVAIRYARLFDVVQ
jgi:signal peptidase I